MKQRNLSNDLQTSGLKCTKHRMAILDILEKQDYPVSADQVFQALQDKHISINLSTVYRTIETLLDKSILKKLTIDGENHAFFEYNQSVHRHYLICLCCKKFLPIISCPLDEYEKALAKETDYVIEGHKLDIYGYCPQCREHLQLP